MDPLQPELIGPGDRSQKMCATCNVVQPANPFYFQRDASTDDGWCAKCKVCRNKYKQEIDNRKIAADIATIQHNLLANIANGGGRAVMCDLVSGGEVFLQAFGGIEGLAQKFAADYESMPLGSFGRTKVLLGILQFVQKAMEQQQPVRLEDMDEGQLREELKRVLGDECRRITDQPEDRSSVGDEE